jgi:hypothetical protein
MKCCVSFLVFPVEQGFLSDLNIYVFANAYDCETLSKLNSAALGVHESKQLEAICLRKMNKTMQFHG